MKIIIYDKSYTSVTTIFDTSFVGLAYTDKLSGVGSAEFTLKVSDTSTTATNLKHFNRIEICEDDGTVRWIGIIVQKDVYLNIVKVKCLSLIYALQKRIQTSFNVSGYPGTYAYNLLVAENTKEATTILSTGTYDNGASASTTFNYSTGFNIINVLADTAGFYFKIKNSDRKLYFGAQSTVGSDLTSTVTFRYKISLIAQANILKFEVKDDGRAINSKVYGKSSSYTSTQTDSSLQTSYGLLESYKNFREQTNQATLDNITANENRDAKYTPTINLNPSVTDNFETGDNITLQLDNGFLDIDTTALIVEKRVVFTGGQKNISVIIDDEIDDLVTELNDLKYRVRLNNQEL